MKSITTLHFRKNNFIPVFLWILFLTGINSNAQNIYSVLNESWTNNNWQKETQTLNTYDGSNYLTYSLTQSWVIPPGIWENSFQINYTNNGDGTVNQSVAQSWDSGSSTWNNVLRNLYTYTAAKEVQTNTSQIWVGDWLNSSKTTNAYDVSGYLTNTLNQSWDFISSTWKNTSQTNFTNNANGTVNQSTTQIWNISNVWVNSQRTSYTYTAANKVLVATTEIWTGTNWLNDTKITNTYNGSGYITNSLSQDWNTTSNTWINSTQSIYTNSPSGNPTQIVSQNWVLASSTWVNASRITFNYNLEIEDFSTKKSLVVYPNPSTGLITVKYNNSFNPVYSITDQTGRIIQKGSLQSEITTLDISTLSKGVYFFRIDKNNLKIIKN